MQDPRRDVQHREQEKQREQRLLRVYIGRACDLDLCEDSSDEDEHIGRVELLHEADGLGRHSELEGGER